MIILDDFFVVVNIFSCKPKFYSIKSLFLILYRGILLIYFHTEKSASILIYFVKEMSIKYFNFKYLL